MRGKQKDILEGVGDFELKSYKINHFFWKILSFCVWKLFSNGFEEITRRK